MARQAAIELFRREVIPRHDDEPYLERLIVFRCDWFSVLLHKFVGGDDECMHDHPWSFVSILLKGGYTEWTPLFADDECRELLSNFTALNVNPETAEIGRWYGPGSILYRPAAWTHRVDILQQKSVISLVIHGPKVRSWGFWTKLKGWLHHSKYSYHKHCA